MGSLLDVRSYIYTSIRCACRYLILVRLLTSLRSWIRNSGKNPLSFHFLPQASVDGTRSLALSLSQFPCVWLCICVVHDTLYLMIHMEHKSQFVGNIKGKKRRLHRILYDIVIGIMITLLHNAYHIDHINIYTSSESNVLSVSPFWQFKINKRDCHKICWLHSNHYLSRAKRDHLQKLFTRKRCFQPSIFSSKTKATRKLK